jgi:hypothetical protein
MGMHTNGPERCPCCGKNGDGKGCHRCRPLIDGIAKAVRPILVPWEEQDMQMQAEVTAEMNEVAKAAVREWHDLQKSA